MEPHKAHHGTSRLPVPWDHRRREWHGRDYADARNGDDPDDGTLRQDVWFGHSHGGETWEEEHLTGPFERPNVFPGFYHLGGGTHGNARVHEGNLIK